MLGSRSGRGRSALQRMWRRPGSDADRADGQRDGDAACKPHGSTDAGERID